MQLRLIRPDLKQRPQLYLVLKPVRQNSGLNGDLDSRHRDGSRRNSVVSL